MNIAYFRFFNFPRAAVLNFYDVKWLPNCFKQKRVASWSENG